MSRLLVAVALIGAAATPAIAAPSPREPAPNYSYLPPELASGQMIDELGSMLGAVSRALLNLPVGELEAAVENRPSNRADRAKTVRSVTGMDERDVDDGIAQGKGAVKAGSQAMSRALPVVVEALNRAGEEIARAAANLPQPGYPRR